MERVAKLIVVILLFSFFIRSSANTENRERYTLIKPNISFIFENHEIFPYRIIREMCWDSSVGFCDDFGNETPYVIFNVIDWEYQKHGAIYQTENGCYWWMYQNEYGVDNSPHILEHFWIECPNS